MKHFQQLSENNRTAINYTVKRAFNPDFINIFRDGEKLEDVYIRRERATWETKHNYSFTLTNRKTHEAVGSPHKTAQKALKYFLARFLAILILAIILIQGNGSFMFLDCKDDVLCRVRTVPPKFIDSDLVAAWWRFV